ncbi:MAG: hypothetical protein COT14_02900 [Candidatus Diapherotrites archaeon CG08_land_8_20_14_0_20_30_16]|nr:MAG: hypothetical protein COT14_02900 [Candidatus Diapherotrites archaeon CG08_land_8_20_14_0_20_30_16]
MANILKTNCPICSSSLNLGNKKNEILVCPFCQNSLFSYKDKKETRLMPFAINIGTINNKLTQQKEFEMNDAPFDDFGDFDEDESE